MEREIFAESGRRNLLNHCTNYTVVEKLFWKTVPVGVKRKVNGGTL